MKPSVWVLSALLVVGIPGCDSVESEDTAAVVAAEAADPAPARTAEDSPVPQPSREPEADTPAPEPERQEAPPARDRSLLSFVIGNARVLVTDSAGRREGIDPATGQEFEEIPRAVHYADAIDNDVTGEPADRFSFLVDIPRPSEGTYRVLVNGQEQGSRELYASAVTVEGLVQSFLRASVILEVGSKSLFEVEYSSTPGANSRLTRLATFESTLEDISRSSALGLIPQEGIADELTRLLRAAAEAAAANDSGASRDHLEEFRTLLQSLVPPQIDTASAQALRQDAEYLLGDREHGGNH
jgi:hypothetical protein